MNLRCRLLLHSYVLTIDEIKDEGLDQYAVSRWHFECSRCGVTNENYPDHGYRTLTLQLVLSLAVVAVSLWRLTWVQPPWTYVEIGLIGVYSVFAYEMYKTRRSQYGN